MARALEEWGVDREDVAYGSGADLLLAASELVTNAAKARSHTFTLEVQAHRDYVELKVTDEDPRPARRLAPGPDQSNGRGLGIVDTLATTWGQTDYDGRAKQVWCRVAVPAGSALGEGCRL